MKDQIHLLRLFRNQARRFPLLGFFPLLAVILFVSLACNLGGPTPPTNRPSVVPPTSSTDWRSILSNAKPGETVNLSLTENDLTQILASQAPSSGNFVVHDPRVILQNGQMQVYGQAVTSAVTANFKATLDVIVGPGGKISTQVVDANFGNIPVPGNLRQQMTDYLNQSLSNALGPAQSQFKVNSIQINDGYMTINGTIE